MEDWHVKEVTTEMHESGEEVFVVRMEQPSGVDKIHKMPTKIIGYRAAEFDIDHTTEEGRAQIIDMALHEIHIDEDEAVVRRASLGIPRATDAVHLWNASSRAEARKARLKQVEEVKKQKVNIVWDKNPPRGASRKLVAKAEEVDSSCSAFVDHQVDEEQFENHKKLVRWVRHKLGAQILPESELPRVAAPKQHLDDGLQRRNEILRNEQR